MADRPDEHKHTIQRIREGDRVALSRAITLVESTRPQDRQRAHALIRTAQQQEVGATLRIGVTGIPGVGKSTLIDALGSLLIERGHRVAVLAIDPSSTRTRGSILGDKTRMGRLAGHEDAFIRPTPSGGTLGGVARRSREAIILCEVAGYDRILVETVGVGQNEAAVDRLTDLNLLLMIGGTGDGIQGIKRGIMEVADLIALNKTDGDNEQRNQRAAMELKQAIALLPPRPNGQRAPVLLCSATTGKGMARLADELERIATIDVQSGYQQARRSEQALGWMDAAIEEALTSDFHAHPEVRALLPRLRVALTAGRIGPFEAADQLIDAYRSDASPEADR